MITIIASVKSTRWRNSGILKMLVNAEIIRLDELNRTARWLVTIRSRPENSACQHGGSAGFFDLLPGGSADAIDLKVELLADFTAAEDLNAVERAAHEPGPPEKFSLIAGAIVESLFQIIEIDDAVNGLERRVVESAFGSRRCRGIWPPSKPGRIVPPERAFWPLWPLPEVLPCPELSPRPSACVDACARVRFQIVSLMELGPRQGERILECWLCREF